MVASRECRGTRGVGRVARRRRACGGRYDRQMPAEQEVQRERAQLRPVGHRRAGQPFRAGGDVAASAAAHNLAKITPGYRRPGRFEIVGLVRARGSRRPRGGQRRLRGHTPRSENAPRPDPGPPARPASTRPRPAAYRASSSRPCHRPQLQAPAARAACVPGSRRPSTATTTSSASSATLSAPGQRPLPSARRSPWPAPPPLPATRQSTPPARTRAITPSIGISASDCTPPRHHIHQIRYAMHQPTAGPGANANHPQQHQQ